METCADSVNKVFPKVYKHLKVKHDKGIVLQPRKKSKKGYKPSHGEVSCFQISLERLLSFSIIILGRSVPPNYMCLKICSSSTGYWQDTPHIAWWPDQVCLKRKRKKVKLAAIARFHLQYFVDLSLYSINNPLRKVSNFKLQYMLDKYQKLNIRDHTKNVVNKFLQENSKQLLNNSTSSHIAPHCPIISGSWHFQHPSHNVLPR